MSIIFTSDPQTCRGVSFAIPLQLPHPMVRQIAIGPQAVAEEVVNWSREKRKKQNLQRTMIGMTSLMGGFALIGRCQTFFQLHWAQSVGLMAFWFMLIVRILWSYVWFPVMVTETPDTNPAVNEGNPAAAGLIRRPARK